MPLQLSVDRTSPVPLYFQLSQQLEAAIEHGAASPPGSLLGNEIELAGRLGLSRPTVRQAIQSLVDKGLLVRRRGVGTQVVHSQVKRPLELSSLYDDLEAAGQRPATRVLATRSARRRPRSPPRSRSPRAARCSWVERLRYAHDEPMAYLCNHLPPGLLDCDTGRLEATGLYRMMRAARHHPAQRPPVRRRPRRHRGRGRAARRAGRGARCSRCSAPRSTTRAAPSSSASHIYRASRYSFEFQLLVRP